MTAGLRKTALALVAMHPADRRWMLSRMSSTQRSLLDPLIKDALRFARIDAGLLQAALTDEGARVLTEVPTPDILIAVLDGLSTQWASRVLTGVASDHAEIYLAACDKLRNEDIRKEIAHLPRPFPGALAGSIARYLSEAGREVLAAERAT